MNLYATDSFAIFPDVTSLHFTSPKRKIESRTFARHTLNLARTAVNMLRAFWLPMASSSASRVESSRLCRLERFEARQLLSANVCQHVDGLDAEHTCDPCDENQASLPIEWQAPIAAPRTQSQFQLPFSGKHSEPASPTQECDPSEFESNLEDSDDENEDEEIDLDLDELEPSTPPTSENEPEDEDPEGGVLPEEETDEPRDAPPAFESNLEDSDDDDEDVDLDLEDLDEPEPSAPPTSENEPEDEDPEGGVPPEEEMDEPRDATAGLRVELGRF